MLLHQTQRLCILSLVSIVLLMFIGSQNIDAIKFGEQTVVRAYFGSEQVYSEPQPDGYDIFIVAGQSNVYFGRSSVDTVPDATLDATDSRIKQLNQSGSVVSASEPLDNFLPAPSNSIGFALTFAKKYADELMAPNRQVLLVPCGRSSGGFSNSIWNSGDAIDTSTMSRGDTALAAGSDTNIIRGILWMQGETDAMAGGSWVTGYQTNLLALIDRWRTHWGDSDIPFIAGGMVPAWVTQDTDYQAVQADLADIVNQRSYTGYANPETPTELVADLALDDIHYSADSQRGGSSRDMNDADTLGMAGRFYQGYVQSLSNY